MIAISKTGSVSTSISPAILIWLFSISLSLTPAFVSAAPQASEQQLQQLRNDISTIKKNIGSDKKKQQQYQEELRDLEQGIAKLSRKQRQTRQALDKQQQDLQQLNEEAGDVRRRLMQQKHNLGQQFRAGYSSGQQQALKLLLNQTDPGAAGRNMSYYGYFTRAQINTIKQTQSGIQQLAITERQLQSSSNRLKILQDDYDTQKQDLLAQQQQRKTLLSKLNSNINSKEQRLNILLEDEKSLSSLLKNLVTPPHDGGDFSNLAKLKGKLKWPTKGTINNRYGSSRNQGRMKWQGITIAGKEGQDIKAIAPGQVIFADWIRGYGLMLIVDHGQGYMSLYGQNQSLYKDVGDNVAASEVIAALGNSGGNQNTSLYFEMRHQGKPINPETWCR